MDNILLTGFDDPQVYYRLPENHFPLVMRQAFFPFQNNSKKVDPSCKMDLDFWDCFKREKLS